MENIDELKTSISGEPTYKLRNGNLFVSPGGLHFLDQLDPTEEISREVEVSNLTTQHKDYIEKSLHSNSERIEQQLEIVKDFLKIDSSRVLDIGCGGGLFLSEIEKLGGKAFGSELDDNRVHYAISVYGIEVHKRPVEDDFWQETHKEGFDAVTLWDVIEHVNFPFATLKNARNLIRKNGLIFIDTPCRDGLFYKLGELSYKLSRGRFATFLNSIYSSKPFGHKQVFSTAEMELLLEEAGFEVISIEKIHELSLPYDFYLRRMFKKELLVELALPLVRLFFSIFRVKNKMLAIAKKE